uniref:Ciliosis and planar polarity effector complex subunit 1 n=1 Tax=Monodelphis domestica TaxID=13616 RepID=A0A5F8GH69_MONDO
MEVKLEVLLSTSIRQKKPWPRISWLGQEKEAIFLLDDRHVNEINLPSGKTKKKIPRLQLLLKNVVILTTSSNDAWLAGILNTGEIFLWNKDHDCLKTVSATEESKTLITAALESSLRLYIYISGDGKRILLAIPSGFILLWECLESKNILYSKNSSLLGQWSQIKPEESVILPSSEDKEAVVDAIFIRNELLGDCCLCSFTFYSGEYLMLTLLALQWPENISQSISLLSYQVHWAHQECFLCTLVPKCESIKSRGALIIAFSRDGLTLAVTLNQKDPKATQILFINILNFVTLCGSLKGCSNKNPVVPSKLIRSYWVGDISWTHDSLFLACVLKRGSLVLLTCLGELLTLVTFGCSIEFGPAEFIPLHPLITYRPQQFVPQDSSCSLDSTASDNDLMRQRFSVKTHSRLPYLIVSDGYMVTVLRFFDNLSPSVLMKSYLLESSQRLEKIHQGLTCQSKRKNLRLRSLESLRASLLKHQGNQSSVASATPRFLQAEEEVGELTEKMADLQDYEVEESNNSKQFINNFLPFWSQKSDSLFNEIEEGRLEFASMFDTIHAKDDTKENDAIITELHSIQKNLLAAWNIGISKNVENKQLMLNYIVICITHFLYVLQFVKLPSPKQNLPLNKTLRHNLWLQCVFRLFHQCLSVQYWDLRYRQDVGHLVKLTSQTLKLMFIQQQHDQLFSDTLLGCFNLLKMVSDSLNSIYSLQHQVISTADGNKIVNHESLVVPIFQKFSHNCTQKSWPWNSFLKIPPPSINLVQKPSHRLSILWQLLYKQTLWYQAHLSRMDPKDDRQLTEKIALEESIARSLLCHIQANLQTAGYCLNQALELKPVIGEEYFLLGSYEESIQLWKKALQEIRTTGGKRTCLLQTRYYLAQLYCHLYCYNLNDAQGMCDQLVREILRQSQMPIKEEEYFPGIFHCAFGIIGNVHPEAAVVVVKCMARFMAAYFTNQKLYVLPPHNVDVLPPLHIESEQSVRIIPLQHSKVASVIRDQNLSYVWTVEYALELLFITGLVPEAVWLSHRLGDWKMAVSIGLAFKLCYKSNSILSRCKKKDLILPLNMTPTRTFQEKLQYFLGQPASLEVAHELGPKYKQFTDPIEEEDVHLLFSSIQEVLKAAVMADADILSETFQLLIDSAKDFSKRLWGLVPVGLYLPSPPLYCPQPAVLSEDHGDDLLLKAEKDYRQKVSGILQRILLLFRAACCSFPAAQWYILKLRWARKVMQKIRIKGFLPSLSPFPESLLHYCKVGMAFYQPGASQDQKLDEVSCKTIGCFRELCALCWMLHVREKLSYSCRQYQIARENMEKKKDMELEFDSCMVEHCLSALEWACRMLPFSRFMNIEELVQDIILSLIGELPPTRKVAEILVKAFPNSEDIRVPLRDKYNSLQQRLRHCTVKGPQTEEMMSVIMHSIHKVRVKALKRVRRNIGPTEMNIWEPPEEETTDKVHTYNGFSLETSLSRSTFTEGEDSVAHSESGTMFELFKKFIFCYRNTQHHAESTLINTHDSKKEKINSEDYPESKGDHENLPRENPVPIVGVWEFERDDDEYIKFLDLFLSYVLERDLIGSNNSSIPFLSSFSAHLKEHELNSLLFDVHTTLKRRQGKPKSQNIFRAGSCYVIIPESCESEKSSTLNSENIRDLENQTSTPSVLVVQGPRSFIQNSSIKVIQNMEKRGLFGLKEKSVYRTRDDNREMPTLHRLSKQVFLPQNFKTPKFAYKAVQWDDIIPHEELPLELKNKFGTIAKLLEWMIRWSDRRLLCDSTKPEPSCQYSPVIRVRTSAAAILTSLWLLEQSYARQQTSHVTCKSSLLPTLVSDPTSVSSNTPISKRHRRHKNESREQMPNSSEPVRQMLQDELFRLVQLQQINFLSLMQIVGSSFSSLPNIQLTQQHLEGSQISGATGGSGDVEHSVKNLNKDLQLRSNGENSRQFEKRRPHHEGIVHSDQNKVRHIQNIPSFCAPSGHLDVSSKNEGVIPQGLGSSTPCSPTVAASNPFHLLSTTPTVDKSPMLIPAVKTLNPANGFPLLKIQMKPEFKPLPVHPVRTPQVPFRPPPEPKEAWGLSSSGKKYLSLYDVETVETPKHLNLDQYIDQEKMTPQQDSAAKRQEKAFDVKPEPSEMHNQDFLGVPLLHLQFNPTMFSTASRTSFATPSIPSRPKEKEKDLKEILYPSIKLLHTLYKCHIMFQLTFFLRYNFFSFSFVSFLFLLIKFNFILFYDRERRRAKKELEEKSSEKQEKKCVTFQSEDSIINHNDFKVVMKQEVEEIFPYISESLGKDISTSAALHFMASVKKKVVENQDASTNTDPGKTLFFLFSFFFLFFFCGCLFARISSILQKLQSFIENSKFNSSNFLQLQVGHNYINVIDIEASDLLQELPDREETTDDIVNKKESDNLEIPSSANLHYMAASVTNAIPPDHFLSKGNSFPFTFLEQEKPIWNSPLPSFVFIIPGTSLFIIFLSLILNFVYFNIKDLPKLQVQVQESTVKSDGVEDYLTWKQCQDFSTTPCTVPSKKGLDIEHLNSKLLEIDEKLLVLQDIAATVEEDFSNTKLVDPPCAVSIIFSFLFVFVLADLQISGLTDVADIINDLITESGISSEELGLTEYQAKKLSRIHSTPKRKKSQRTEKEKREIRAWMKKKRKERMAEYLAQLAVKREQEHEPFQSPRKQLCMTSKEIRMCQKMKTEKDRLQLSEHYHRRVAQAYNLMNELLVESAQTTGISPTKPPCGPAKSFRISTRQRHLPPRGILLTVSGICHMYKYSHVCNLCFVSFEDFGYPCPRARSIKDSKTSSTTTNTEEYGRQHSLANSWALPEEIDKILSRSPNSSLEDISPPEDEGFPISINGLDSGSESTGSILSKIDWRAVDDMVASVENR